MSPRSHFEQELNTLNHKLIKMASFVEESIKKAIDALKTQNVKLAEKIIKEDDIADNYEQKIEKYCINLIAKEQPLAGDLREISTTLKIITDLERIADHSSDISELTIRIAKQKHVKPLIDIPEMASIAQKMVTQSIDSYVRNDISLAQKVCDTDDEVDNLFSKIILELIPIMKNNPETVDQCIDLMFVTKYLERMGDHATNIAEWAIYRETGKHKSQ